MRRVALALAVLAVAAAGCGSPLGRDVPECELGISNTLVLEVQSLPTAAYVPCIAGLRPGWEYKHAHIESGRTVFWLDSDRMGEPFITVEGLPSCDPGSAVPARSGQPDVRLFQDVTSETTVEIVLVPERPSAATAARAVDILGEVSGTRIKGRTVAIVTSASPGTTADRIEIAAATGAHVISISIRDAEEGTLTLQLAGRAEEIEADDLEDALEKIEDAETPPTYTGNWYYVFEGGCVVYTFDARGIGVDMIERDIPLALGLFDAEALREFARDSGYNI